MRPWVLVMVTLASAVLGAAMVLGAQAWSGRDAPAGAGGGEAVRAYLLEHPEVLPEAMARLQAREASRALDANRDAVTRPFPGAVAGNPAGDVTVVAWLDYACGYCRASLPAIAQVIARDPKVRVVYRELPILSPASRRAAEWALAAARQGRFLPFHQALYDGGRVDDAAIARAAAAAGLDVARARTDAAGPDIAAEIERNLRTAGALGFTGTPSWVVGDRVLGGAQTPETLAAAVAAARAGVTG